MSYEASKTPKVILGLIGCSVVLFFGYIAVSDVTKRVGELGRAKFVKETWAACERKSGIKAATLPEKDIVTFDMEVKNFYARNEAELSFISCMEQDAPDFFDARASSKVPCDQPGAIAGLQRREWGRNYAPPVENFRFLAFDCLPSEPAQSGAAI